MADKITAKDLAEKKDNFVLIDVREKDEIAEDGGATIEGAVNIPLGQLIRKARQGRLDDLKGKTICTYCNGGYRGNIGAAVTNYNYLLSMHYILIPKDTKNSIVNNSIEQKRGEGGNFGD